MSKKLDGKTWQLNSKDFSLENVHAVEILTNIQRDVDEAKLNTKVKIAINSLIESALYNGPTQAFFISKDPSVNVLQTNLHLLKCLTEYK